MAPTSAGCFRPGGLRAEDRPSECCETLAAPIPSSVLGCFPDHQTPASPGRRGLPVFMQAAASGESPCYPRAMSTHEHVENAPAFGRAVREDWPIDFSSTFLNHGSFGSVPHLVHAEAEKWRARFEAHPMEWFWRRGSDVVREAANKVATFLGAEPDNLGFVVNATAAANAVLRDMPLESGQEVVVLNHGYNAVKQAARHAVAMRDAKIVEVPIPLPIRNGPQEIVTAR